MISIRKLLGKAGWKTIEPEMASTVNRIGILGLLCPFFIGFVCTAENLFRTNQSLYLINVSGQRSGYNGLAIHDVTTGVLYTSKNAPTSMLMPSAAIVNNTAYVVGEAEQLHGNFSLFSYDFKTDEWLELLPLPKSQAGHTLLAHQSWVVCITRHPHPHAKSKISYFYLYDAQNRTWLHLNDTIPFRYENAYGSLVSVDDGVGNNSYMFGSGGVFMGDPSYKTNEAFFRSITERVPLLAIMQTDRACHQSVRLDENVYVFGGSCPWETNIVQTTEIFNLSARSWSNGPTMLSARKRFSAALIPATRKILICGAVLNETISSCEVLDSVSKAWGAVNLTLSDDFSELDDRVHVQPSMFFITEVPAVVTAALTASSTPTTSTTTAPTLMTNTADDDVVDEDDFLMAIAVALGMPLPDVFYPNSTDALFGNDTVIKLPVDAAKSAADASFLSISTGEAAAAVVEHHAKHSNDAWLNYFAVDSDAASIQQANSIGTSYSFSSYTFVLNLASFAWLSIQKLRP